MEAGRLPERERELAPAPDSDDPTQLRGGGWTPSDPAPLGLAGFALTTFMLSMLNANLVSSSALSIVLPVALAYGGIAQLLAGMWEFRTGNTFGAVAFTSFGAFWISFFVLVQFELGSIPPAEVGAALGLYLWAWGIFAAWMTVAALRTTAAIALLFALVAITLILLGIGNAGAHETIIHWGGYVGLAAAILAWYIAMASVVNSVWGRTLMPVFPIGS